MCEFKLCTYTWVFLEFSQEFEHVVSALGEEDHFFGYQRLVGELELVKRRHTAYNKRDEQLVLEITEHFLDVFGLSRTKYEKRCIQCIFRDTVVVRIRFFK